MIRTVAITMGDPAGIGPEIIAQLLTRAYPFGCRVLVVGSSAALTRALIRIASPVKIPHITRIEQLPPAGPCILDDGFLITLPPFGIWSADTGRASYHWIHQSIDLALEHQVDAVVTGPVSKEALHAGGIPFPGHTEIFAHFTKAQNYSMMFMLEGICVSHVTTHCSLKKAIELVTAERVFNNIVLLNSTLISLGHAAPRIAVGGLNPHAGEGGLFGDEEIHEIIPAITKAKELGIDVSGPHPPDTVFHRAFHGEFDGIVSMLHDHGFVALKSRDFDHGVNITVGLPIVRTSVGHGTAFDIAGKGIASEKSLVCAIEAAMKMSSKRTILQ